MSANRRRWAIGCVLVAGCAMQVEGSAELDGDEPVGVTAQAITGGQSYVSCTDAERGRIRSAAIVGRAIVFGDAFVQCLDRTMRTGDGGFGPYRPFAGDPPAPNMSAHVLNVLGAARNGFPAQVTCELLQAGALGQATFQPFPNDHVEVFSLDEDFLADREFEIGDTVAAAVMWHEAMHAHNYRHSAGERRSPGNEPGFTDKVPYFMDHCIESVAADSFNRCGLVRQCPRGATIPVVTSYPNGTGCTCVRDPLPGLPAGAPTPTDGRSPGSDISEGGDRFGTAIARGDFNGDHLLDMAVGIPNEGLDAANTLKAGLVQVYVGTEEGLYPSQLLTEAGLATATSGDQFGVALAAGDFDRDGYDDLAVGAPGALGSGRVFLFRGSSNGLAPNRALTQAGLGLDEAGDSFGSALVARREGPSAVGLVVSAPNEKIGSNPAASGYAFVFVSDRANMLAPGVGLSQSGLDTDEAGDRFGISLATGRIDSDVPDDIVVGAPGEDGSTGAAYVYLTRSGFPGTIQDRFKLAAPADAVGGQAGTSVAVGRFVDATFNSVAVGIPFWNTSNFQGGIGIYNGHVIFPAPTPAQRLRFSWKGTASGGLAGYALATVTRSSATFDQLAVGAPAAFGGGAVFMLAGASDGMSVHSSFTQSDLDASEPNDLFGSALSMSSLGSGGSPELVVGAVGEAVGTSPANAGAVYIFRVGGGSPSGTKFHVQGE